ncbi:MAG: hypothetical protein FJX52_12615, partial [Alphaproteobacteria bacterium]|nr:hypothetical protein [Alphaproteobacteria bacterium]
MSGLFRVLIFATGGSIIALELLASRIMTPYFGVSLYIWSGILSITLVALALGYYGGGWLAQRIAGRRDEGGQLAHLFLLMPAIAALGLALSCLIYPWAFFYLARADVVLGAFAACLVLLFVPLVATSAMNPLLVAVQRSLREAGATAEADAGAGRVLFISTAGSVAGVLITAFVLIPNVTNFTAVLWIAVALGLISAVTPYLVRGVIHRRRLIVILGAAGAAASVILLALSDWMLGRSTEISHGGARWRLERAYGSLFGSVKVLKAASAGAPDQFVRYFYQDGIVQNRVDAQGVSQTLFTYALEAIAMGYRPEAKSALML